MRKTLFSVLPLVVLLVPSFAPVNLFSFALFRAKAPGVAAVAEVSPEHSAVEALRARVAEAKLLLRSRPAPETHDQVTLAVEEADGGQIHLVTLDKETFLTENAVASLVSSEGALLRLRVVRPNYVNTVVRVSDERGRELRPLVVQYPIEKGGKLTEVAYYTSAHPAVSSEALVKGGASYVRARLETAQRKLAAKGKTISPEVVDVAERLCVVEHTDHKRFKTERHAPLFEEIYALYALNSGDTYRYSVSSAGAGGMVQMIPPTYKAMRERYPQVPMAEDFVTAMRDHDNAAAVMLLYIQDTWTDLLKEEEVRDALSTKLATQAELLAAGYNSNPRRLAGYLKRGGDGWRTLIPEETQMYLRIYASVEENVMRPRTAATLTSPGA
jgi:hypothetical protein